MVHHFHFFPFFFSVFCFPRCPVCCKRALLLLLLRPSGFSPKLPSCSCSCSYSCSSPTISRVSVSSSHAHGFSSLHGTRLFLLRSVTSSLISLYSSLHYNLRLLSYFWVLVVQRRFVAEGLIWEATNFELGMLDIELLNSWFPQFWIGGKFGNDFWN